MKPCAPGIPFEASATPAAVRQGARCVWSLIAHRLGVRVHGRVPLQAMVHDYVHGIQPGSRHSLLCDSTDRDLARYHRLLTRELSGAVEDVVEAFEVAGLPDLVHLAARLAESADYGDVDNLRAWMGCARMVVPDIDFFPTAFGGED